MNEERMINLEIRYSHQEEFLSQLNKIVTDQQKTIERLQKEVLDLKGSMNLTNSVDAHRTLKDDKPPHY